MSKKEDSRVAGLVYLIECRDREIARLQAWLRELADGRPEFIAALDARVLAPSQIAEAEAFMAKTR